MPCDGAGEAVAYRFEASAPLDFNIHFHRGKDVEYPVKIERTPRHDAAFSAPSAETFCWMWTSRSAGAVRVSGSVVTDAK